MKSFYLKHFSKKNFNILSITLCLLLDLAILSWAYIKFTNLNIIYEALETLKTIPQYAELLEFRGREEMALQIIKILRPFLIIIISVFLTFHSIIYFSFFKGKSYARKYLIFFSTSASVLSFLTVLFSLDNFSLLIMALFATLIYFFVAAGLFSFKINNEEQ